MPVHESEYSPSGKTGGTVSHYSLSPSKSVRSAYDDVENVPPEAYSEGTHLAMSDNASELRSRMEAELIALRRAQSIFAESHPSVDVHAKLQDLQEMYIGDLLVKDCQLSQLRNQLETLASERSARSALSTPSATSAVPPPHASMLAARVQSLQKAVSQERHRRMEVEHRLEEMLKSNENSGANEKAQLSRLTSSHRLEVHQLKSKLSQLSEANKQLQQQLQQTASKSVEQSPAPTATGASSPASSCVGGTEKVAYVKYAQLRAEKRQIEAKLNAQIEELKSELSQALTTKSTEIEKLEEHHRRVIADLERKTRLAQQTRSEEGKELKELRPLYEKLLLGKSQTETLNFEYKRRIDDLERDLESRETELNEISESEKFLALELEEREKVIAQLEMKDSKSGPMEAELERLREERLDLLEKVEEREDMLKSLQDESGKNREKIADLEAKILHKDKEVATMVAQADELDSLLSRADQDVTSSRLKIQALTTELDAIRATSGASNSELKLKIIGLEEEIRKRDSELRKLEDTCRDREGEITKLEAAVREKEEEIRKTTHRLESVLDERDRLTSRIENILSSPKKQAALMDAEKKIGQLERELDSMRKAIEVAGSGNDDSIVSDRNPRPLSPEDDSYFGQLTERVAQAESLFHQAVDVCTDAHFEEAVGLLEQAAKTLASLPKEEIDMNDPGTLRVLESDIYGQLGVAFQCLSQVPEAIQAYATAVEVDPEAHACHANLAVLLQHQSRLKEAEQHAQEAVRLAPEIEEYQQLLAQIESQDFELPQTLLRHSTRW